MSPPPVTQPKERRAPSAARSALGRAAVVVVPLLLVPLAALLLLRKVVPDRAALAPPPTAEARTLPEAPKRDEQGSPDVRGRVFDSDGNLVQGATVRLVLPSHAFQVMSETTSDTSGSFSFASAKGDGLRVVADHEPQGFGSSEPVRVTEGRSTEVTVILSEAGAVRGVVVDSEQHPVTGATLAVEWPAWPVPTATSDESGAFQLKVVPDEATSLVASARGYASAVAALGPREERAKIVLHVELATGGPVEGDVHGVDGEPVRARVVACAGQPLEAKTMSTADGTFQLPARTVGCTAVADLEGFGSSDPTAVVEGRANHLVLKAGGTIEGVVVDERGHGVQSFSIGIEAFASAGRKHIDGGAARKFEDPRGSFRWDKLTPGSYVLSASAPGKPPTRSEPIDVRAETVTRNVRIALLPGGSVVGRVTDERHAPLVGATIRFDFLSAVLESGGSVRTDDDGRYRLDGAPSGPVSLWVHKDTFIDRAVSGVRVDSGKTVTVDIALVDFDGGAYFVMGGIGASLRTTDDGVEFQSLGAGDPGARAGLQEGDRVLRVDGESADGMSVADVVQRLRGEVSTIVGVSVFRPKTGETLDLTITRGNIVR
jgi:hypothetical protein